MKNLPKIVLMIGFALVIATFTAFTFKKVNENKRKAEFEAFVKKFPVQTLPFKITEDNLKNLAEPHKLRDSVNLIDKTFADFIPNYDANRFSRMPIHSEHFVVAKLRKDESFTMLVYVTKENRGIYSKTDISSKSTRVHYRLVTYDKSGNIIDCKLFAQQIPNAPSFLTGTINTDLTVAVSKLALKYETTQRLGTEKKLISKEVVSVKNYTVGISGEITEVGVKEEVNKGANSKAL
ncbi:MAG: hypothetical protein H7Y04_05240 [Verrucomicrobia bacterium]|nr:hypothetical protein [Cytophagales bacterium]